MTKIMLGGEPTSRIRGLYIRQGCDLRASLEEKMSVAGAGWELQTNVRGYLAHLVHGTEGIIIRIPAVGGEVFSSPVYARRVVGMRVGRAVAGLPADMKRAGK